MEPGRLVSSSRECWDGGKWRAGFGDLLACFRWLYGQWREEVKAQSWLRTMIWACKYHICKSTCYSLFFVPWLPNKISTGCLLVYYALFFPVSSWLVPIFLPTKNEGLDIVNLSEFKSWGRNHVLLLVRTWTWNSMGISFSLKGSPFPSARTQTRHKSTWNWSRN